MYELAASRRQAERVEREERAREVHKKSSSLRTASSRKKQSSMSRQSSGVGRHRNKQEVGFSTKSQNPEEKNQRHILMLTLT